jgi:hypothetical protein
MIQLVRTVCLTAALAGAGDASVRDLAHIALQVDRDSYYVGEPVRLRLTVRNVGARRLYVYPQLQPYLAGDLATVRLSYCRDDLPCVEFVGRLRNDDRADVLSVPLSLMPAQEASRELSVAWNPETNALVLGAPGSYRFRVRYRGVHVIQPISPRAPTEELLAESSPVTAWAVPEAEQAAFEEYRRSDLARMAQYVWIFKGDISKAIDQAAVFLERHAQSVYAPFVRRGLLELLRAKLVSGTATPAERDLLRLQQGPDSP